MVINCENVLCIFNAEKNCIKDCVSLNNEACCSNSIVITETEKNRLKDYYCNCIVNKVNEETTKLYSNTELEDLYVGQGLSIKSVSEITGIAKTTLYNRLKSAGLIDKKKAKLEGF